MGWTPGLPLLMLDLGCSLLFAKEDTAEGWIDAEEIKDLLAKKKKKHKQFLLPNYNQITSK